MYEWEYVPAEATSKIELTKNGYSNYFGRIEITWNVPMGPPTLLERDYNSDYLIGEYPKIDELSKEFHYLQDEFFLRVKLPDGAKYAKYSFNDFDPVTKGEDVNVPGTDNIGVINLPKAVVGQPTKVRVVAFDESDNPSEELTVNCRRVALTAPKAPEATAFYTSGRFENSYGMISMYPEGEIQSMQGTTITLPSEMLVLQLNNEYNSTSTHLIYAISDSPHPEDAVFNVASWWNSCACFNLPSKKISYNGEGWSDLSYPEPTFFVDPGSKNVRSVCYLHLKSVAGNWNSTNPLEKAESAVTTIKIQLAPPEAPAISLAEGSAGTWSNRGSVPSYSYVAGGSKNMVNVKCPTDDADMLIQYAFRAHTAGEAWPGATPDANAVWNALQSPEDNLDVSNLGEGRVYFKCIDTKHNISSPLTILDLEPQIPENLDLEVVISNPEQQLVKLRSSGYPLIVSGAFATDAQLVPGKTTYYLYLVNSHGIAIKAVINSATEPAVFESYRQKVDAGQRLIINDPVIGRMHYNSHTITESGESKPSMPEIWVTPGDEDYTDYLPKAVATDVESYPNKGVIKEEKADGITAADFNKYVTLRSLTWLGGNKVRTADGTELTLYSRLHVDGYDFGEDMANVAKIAAGDGEKLFAATGYVGQLSGTLALLTTEKTVQCPGTPKAYAPNLISGTPDKNGFIQVNAITNRFYIDIVGNADGESELYCFTEEMVRPDQSNQLVNHNGKWAIDVNFGTAGEGKTNTYWVYAKLNDMYSLKPLKLRITKYDATPVHSIKEFKEAERDCTLDHGGNDGEKRYQMTRTDENSTDGMVIILEKTPQYLYVQDYPVSAEAENDDTHMHYLLIRNENEWEAPVDKNGVEAPLEVGDVITGFALRPRHVDGNIVSNSTNFARTFKWVEHVANVPGAKDRPVTYNSETEPSGTDFKFTENDRMTYVTLSGVQVSQEPNPDYDSTDPDSEKNLYYLDIAGAKRTRLTFSIFTTRGGWTEAWAPSVGFNITGIVLRSSATEEAYAFAPISFTGTGKLSAPEVYLDNIAADKRGDTEQPYFGGAVVMNPVATTTAGKPVTGNITIHYSINGLDPLNNIGSRIKYNPGGENPDLALGERTIEVRAFAAAPGLTPSDVVVRRFTKSSSDMQYILNFLNSAKEGNLYRFISNLKVVAIGGEYMFVAGPVGHFLPIYKEGGWNDVSIAANQYISGFTVEYRKDEHENRLAVATTTASTFTGITDEDDIAEDDRIKATPDVVNKVTNANARRLVQIMNVKVNKMTTAANPDETHWTFTELSDGQEHPMIVGRLGKVDVYSIAANGDKVAEEMEDGETYNITGFVMLGANSKEGIVELWPMSAQRIGRTANVTAKVSNTVSQTTAADGEITATFEGNCVVTLEATDHNHVITYWLESETTDQTAATWYTYQRPFTVTANERIHAMAQAPGLAASDHTHVTLTRLDQAAAPAISEASGVVTITAEQGAAITWWTSADATKHTYNAPFTIGETAIVYATASVAGKAESPVAHLLVVINNEEPIIPADKISGKVTFTIDDTSDPTKVTVYLAPEQGLTGTIYYLINPTGEVTPDNGLVYKNPIEMTEGGRIVAILVESGKYAGEPTDIAVWLIPTDISGIDSEEREDAIRAEGGSIIAPEGSEVYDISGRRVSATGLRAGIYIVRTPGGKAVKVKVD
ncbi:MAG: hypothetical protein HFJ94_10510 [Muribaculaceae bacterium]|nr:hypothetical protein [Muribaculaceae bacterium]